MDLIITIIAFLFLVGVVITVHEGGHYLMARVANIKILEFSIGFGKVIFSKKMGKDQTLFTLRLLPLGGFVRPLEKGGLEAKDWDILPESDKVRALNNASRSKKALMVAGGPAFNFILAFILYVFASSFIGITPNPAKIAEITPNSIFLKAGLKEGEIVTKVNNREVKNANDAFSSLANQAIKGKDTEITTDKGSYLIEFSQLDLRQMQDNISKLMGIYFASSEGDIIIKKINDNSPAKSGGLKEDDIIKSVNGVIVNDLGKFIRTINANPEKAIEVELLRANKLQTNIVIPEAKKQDSEVVGKIGASFKTINTKVTDVQKYSLMESVPYSIQKVIDGSYTTLVSLGKLVTGQLSMKSISGPIAIADYSGKSAQVGMYAYISVMAAISIAIGVFNLLPIPLLDGGVLVQYAVEGIRGKDLSDVILKKLQFIGMSILGSMFFIAMFNDIIKIIL